MPYVTLVCGRAKRICEPHWQIPLLPHTNGYGPLANGFSSEFATQGHLVLGPLVPGLGPGAFKSWLDASLTAFGVPPAPHTAKWASGAWCAIIAKVLGLGLASFWARLGNCLGNSILYFWCSSGFCLGTCFGGCFGLAFGTSFCFGQFVESILLILGQIIGLWCLHLPWQWLTITWDAMPYMANNYDDLSSQSPIQWQYGLCTCNLQFLPQLDLKAKNKYDKFQPHWEFGFLVLWLQQLLWLPGFGLPQALLLAQ